jgi:hypothetical protein
MRGAVPPLPAGLRVYGVTLNETKKYYFIKVPLNFKTVTFIVV